MIQWRQEEMIVKNELIIFICKEEFLMKKRVFAIFACTLFTLALATGCGKKAPETPDEPTTGMPAPMETLSEEERMEMYTDAADIYAAIKMLTFDTDTDRTIVKDDYTYYRIHDERFESMDDFQHYLNYFFTKDFIQNELMNENLFIEGKDGYLYVAAAGRGANIFYAGYNMGEAVASENEITFDVTAYYTTDKPYDGEIFTEAPENAADYETEVFQFRLVPEYHLWKFDKFTMFY